MIEKLKSRKLWAAVAGAAVTALGQQLGLNPDQLHWFVGVVIAYIIGQSAVDAAQGTTSNPKPKE